MGDSPVARAVRAETPSSEAQTQPIPKLDPVPAARPRKLRVDDEPEPMRCPGCGVLSRRDRCPSCGAVLRRSDD
jgi:hypothetical protein